MSGISDEEKSIIVGTLLGDGYIYKDRYGGCYLEVKHSEAQKDYVFWLHDKLGSISRSKPYQRKDNNQWRFVSRTSDELKEFRGLFYPRNRKEIPSNISDIHREIGTRKISKDYQKLYYSLFPI